MTIDIDDVKMYVSFYVKGKWKKMINPTFTKDGRYLILALPNANNEWNVEAYKMAIKITKKFKNENGVGESYIDNSGFLLNHYKNDVRRCAKYSIAEHFIFISFNYLYIGRQDEQ